MIKRLREFFHEGDYNIVESKYKDCEQCFWYIVRKPVGIVGDKLSPGSHYWPRFEKLCQPCSEKFREADYEDDDEDDWWRQVKWASLKIQENSKSLTPLLSFKCRNKYLSQCAQGQQIFIKNYGLSRMFSNNSATYSASRIPSGRHE